MTEGIIGAILLGVIGFLGKMFYDRGANKNVKDKARDLAAKKSELLDKKKEMSDLRYEQMKQSLEQDEDRLKKKIKNKEDIDVPDSEVDGVSADDLADRLNEHIS